MIICELLKLETLQIKQIMVDKIFGNSYGSKEVSTEKINFTIAPSYENDLDADESIHQNLLINKVDSLIRGSEFEHLNKVTPAGISKKLNKVQINKVYFYIVSKLGDDYSRIDLFGVISDYFDILPKKFYSSLSNKFKDELIKELDDKYGILKKKKINKLF